ncbi:hypothetical protein K469DRAFT_714907 [Zopfia rhizophila CBS 207.26]|uniref:Uncharacterized protein n=1 Tax=Zopfia rhizophila CBS 207.26 TaxID=1314779 RepID=A0A6A6D979_9PEZI|nr:hypothetical protein K469DRAFT_707636 [Zopfia rhizophila CBS 207.26]KAF2192887.1 hypothetical protein K469DRAFT_714907 [Zopfia rhizophila CBS 207.26]
MLLPSMVKPILLRRPLLKSPIDCIRPMIPEQNQHNNVNRGGIAVNAEMGLPQERPIPVLNAIILDARIAAKVPLVDRATRKRYDELAKKKHAYLWKCCLCDESEIKIMTNVCLVRCAYCKTTKARVHVAKLDALIAR